jgi:isoquinoline 1-oxidoreductase beta subunit
MSTGAATAEVIEIGESEAGIELHKAWAAVHVGIALDPRNIEAQVGGALLFGLSAAIFGEITLRDGRVEQTNFDAYPLLQLHQAPAIEVRILQGGKQIRGVGEIGTPAAAPALGNALYALTGKRVRQLPFRKSFRFA